MRRLDRDMFTWNSIKPVSRADLFSEDVNKLEANADLIARLEGLVQNSLNLPTKESTSKRRKIDGFRGHEPTPFRLLSTSLPPKLISFESKPPPDVVVVTQEPDHEDDVVAAECRMRQAQDVAVDYAWIIEESKKRPILRSNTQKLIQVRVSSFNFSSTTAPAIIRTQKDQPHRASRPPVPPSELLTLPYSSKRSSPSGLTHSHCFTDLDINTLATDYFAKHEKRRRRRRVKKERVQPVFWRPNAAWGGKSAGYALGYPSNWAAYEDDGGTYHRDTMRKGMHIGL